VIKSLKWRDHPPSRHLPGLKPLKGRVKEGRKISDNQKNFGNISEKQPFSEIIPDYLFCTNPVKMERANRKSVSVHESVSVKPGQTDAAGKSGRLIHTNTLA
jgi:hypothetical protein